jgi:hypothetical protein
MSEADAMRLPAHEIAMSYHFFGVVARKAPRNVQAVCDIVQTATESAGYNLTCGALFFKKRMCQTYS